MRKTRCVHAVFMVALLMLASAGVMIAQDIPQEMRIQTAVQGKTVIYSKSGEAGQTTSMFLMSELSADKTATGKPYSADAITEFSQALADGNKIYRKTTARVYRDSRGRTRREQPLEGTDIGSGEGQMIIISDPVAGSTWALNPASQTARKTVRSVVTFKTKGKDDASVVAQDKLWRATAGAPMTISGGMAGGWVMITEPHVGDSANSTTEDLGTQVIEGIQTQGTRTTVTIPAGSIGNQLPIQIVSERWYSPDLEVVVMSRQSDPRVGETIYRLTNLDRSEPSPALFDVPANYHVMEGATLKKRD